MKTKFLVLVIAVAMLAGCGGEPEPLPPEMKQAAAPPAPTATAQQPAATTADSEALPPSTAAAPAAAPAPVAAPVGTPPAAAEVQPPQQSAEDEQWATEADMNGIRQKAGVGMGKNGHSYGGDVFTYPLATYFRVRERVFVDQIKHAMDLYKALNEHWPRTQDEFRREIIKANAMRMAVLPPGHKYYYDAEKGELMVVRPQ